MKVMFLDKQASKSWRQVQFITFVIPLKIEMSMYVKPAVLKVLLFYNEYVNFRWTCKTVNLKKMVKMRCRSDPFQLGMFRRTSFQIDCVSYAPWDAVWSFYHELSNVLCSLDNGSWDTSRKQAVPWKSTFLSLSPLSKWVSKWALGDTVVKPCLKKTAVWRLRFPLGSLMRVA